VTQPQRRGLESNPSPRAVLARVGLQLLEHEGAIAPSAEPPQRRMLTADAVEEMQNRFAFEGQIQLQTQPAADAEIVTLRAEA